MKRRKKSRKNPILVNVWGCKTRGASMAFVCCLPVRQVEAYLTRNHPFYACLEVDMPNETIRRMVAMQPKTPLRVRGQS